MTDRLAHLLDDEAGSLPVPAAPTGAILARGKRQRRRRQAGLTVGAVAAATALVTAGGYLVSLPMGGQEPQVAGATSSSGAVFSVGNTVYYDGPARSAAIDDHTVKSLFYTSAGVLVRHGDNANSDGGGPQRFSLVQADGTVTTLGLVTEETVHASDPDQPYVAYAESVDGRVEAVVYDVVKDEEAARVAVTDSAESWLPVSLDGDRLYVQTGHEGRVFAVGWRAGTAAPAEDLPSAWSVADGRVAGLAGAQPAVLDVATGEVLLSVDRRGYFELSPDGEHAMLVPEHDGSGEESGGFSVYDVESGRAVDLAGTAWEWGWTAAGDVFRVGETEVVTCSAETEECTSESYAAPPGSQPTEVCEIDEGVEVCEEEGGLETRLGGRLYES